MEVALAIVAVVLVVLVVAWFLKGHSPAEREGVETPTQEGHPTETSTFGPAGPGAELQTGPQNRDGGRA